MQRIVLVLFLISAGILSQERIDIINRNDKTSMLKAGVGKAVSDQSTINQSINQVLSNPYHDTLSYKLQKPIWDDLSQLSFGCDPDDIMLQWYEVPGDLLINKIGFWINTREEWRDDKFALEIKILKCNLTKDKIFIPSIYAEQLGYFPASTPIYPYTAFYEDSIRTGDWVSKNGYDYPFSNILWSSDSALTFDQLIFDEYTWVSIDTGSNKISLNKGDILCIAIRNLTPIGAWRSSIHIQSVEGLGIPSFKFYKRGRLLVEWPDTDPGYGWFIRPRYTFDIVADVTYTGDLPPSIENVTNLETTVSTNPQLVEATIRDINPSGGPGGIASAFLLYRVNEGSWKDTPMTTAGDLWSAYIPGQQPGSTIEYYVVARDVEANETESDTYSYKIFEPSFVNTLLVFNGKSDSGYPQNYYLRKLGDDWYDKWAYGELSSELLENYKYVFEFCADGPINDNREAIRTWLSAATERSYFLSGENFFGEFNNYEDRTFVEGDFEYDVLGVSASYNDVSFDGTSGDELPSLIKAVEGSDLGNQLFADFTASGADSLRYDPIYEIAQLANRVDGFDVSTASVDIEVKTRGISSIPQVVWKAAAAHNSTAAGNMVVFTTMDAMSINSSPDYIWWSDSNVSIQYKAAEWFGIITDVEEEETQTIPATYSLSQNYPNPFNPTTTIQYTIPVVALSEVEGQHVTLRIYDILGREVATLVNKQQKPGRYKVEWNAGNVPSGVYFYSISAGEFSDTKKLILLK